MTVAVQAAQQRLLPLQGLLAGLLAGAVVGMISAAAALLPSARRTPAGR